MSGNNRPIKIGPSVCGIPLCDLISLSGKGTSRLVTTSGMVKNTQGNGIDARVDNVPVEDGAFRFDSVQEDMTTQSRDSNAFYYAQGNRKEMAGKVKMIGIPKRLVHETHAIADRRSGSNARIIALQTPAHGHFMLQTLCIMTFHDAHLAIIPFTYCRRIWIFSTKVC